MPQPPLPALEPLPQSFFAHPTSVVARNLLGASMLRRFGKRWVGGRIVETEAYLHEDDLASHSARSRRTSNASMFEAPGTVYVYPIHAKYCFNIVTEAVGLGAAVLVRALEPLWGIEVMMDRRGQRSVERLTSGPAMLCQALGIDRSFDRHHLHELKDLKIVAGDVIDERDTAISRRIGISKSADLQLRYFLRGNRFVSGPRHWHQA